MTLEQAGSWATIMGTILAIPAVAMAAASLSPEARTRLATWWNKTYKVGRVIFMLFALSNGSLGILLFAIASTPPSRMDIIHLLMFILNIATGIAMLWESANNS
jgi:hypothetical protein